MANSGIDCCGLWSKISTHVRESKRVLDCGFHRVDSGFQVLNSSLCQWNLDSGFQIVSGIPDSLSSIPDSKVQHFGFHKQNFPGFRSPQAWGEKWHLENLRKVWCFYVFWFNFILRCYNVKYYILGDFLSKMNYTVYETFLFNGLHAKMNEWI